MKPSGYILPFAVFVAGAAALVFALFAAKGGRGEPPCAALAEASLEASLLRAKNMYSVVAPMQGQLPRSVSASGRLETCDAYFWASGFFPGTLWYLYEYSADERFRRMAETMTRRVEKQKYNRSSHEAGLAIACSFGNAWRILGDSACVEPILTAARSLASRYHERVGCIRSWSGPHSSRWRFPVTIDNLMGLELLCRASQLSGDPRFARIAVKHARTTLRNHFRPDCSSWHVLDYDTLSGAVVARNTWQGYSDASSWSRGQAWGLYGYTMMYRETGHDEFRTQARRIADFIVAHPRLPEDGVPYWDFDDPAIPDALRDASAAAVIASALVELSGFVEQPASERYLRMAERQLRTLSSEAYTNPPGVNCDFILRHGVGFLPAGSEVDAPLSYADYYYVEALMRYRALCRGEKRALPTIHSNR